MSNGALFVSFAESDGGHSYLAARAMLEPSQVGHLVFRNTVSETLDALASGQSNFAVVPFYNSITQWDGATVKALGTGQFEIFAQTCMPTSYVLVAHCEHINIALSLYTAERGFPYAKTPDFTRPIPDPHALKDDATEEEKTAAREGHEAAEEALKIYTRLLTTIFVGAQADEQYRGRLLRPDMNKVNIDLTRNPLRVLEELNRSDLMKSMARASTPQQPSILPQNVSGGSVPFSFAPAPQLLKDFQGPAALVAKGLLDPPGSKEGWDKTGSLGEIVSLLRKLQVLLNVYSFGPPDLPDNKTQYLLLARRGEKIRPIFQPTAGAHGAPLRTMTLIKANPKVHGRNSWMKPRENLYLRTQKYGIVYDRAPLTVSPTGQTVYLQEGGRLKSMGGHANLGEFAEQLKKAIERKPSESAWSSGPTSTVNAAFLGVYPTWSADKTCDGWMCEAAGPNDEEAAPWPAWVGRVIGLLLLIAALYGLFVWHARACEDSDSFVCTGDLQKVFPPAPPSTQPVEPPASAQPETPPAPPPSEPAPHSSEPDHSSSAAPPPLPYPTGHESAPPVVTAPVVVPPPTHVTPPPIAAPPPYVAPEPVFHVAFFEAKSNLTAESLTALRDAAMRALETEKLVRLRIVALGPRETDGELWQRRLQAVKDELVRLGVPADRLMPQGEGPYDVFIRQRVVPSTRSGRQRVTLEVVPDPLTGDDDQ